MAFEKNEGSRPARPVRRGRKKVCSFCVDRIDEIDYKDVARLRKYVSRPDHRNQACPSRRPDALRQRLIADPFQNNQQSAANAARRKARTLKETFLN